MVRGVRGREERCAVRRHAPSRPSAPSPSRFPSSDAREDEGSAADRLLPYPEETLWAPSPPPDSFVDSYDDATGAGRNYVYLVEAADEDGVAREVQLICFGAKSDGEGWLEIEAKGGSGVHYRQANEEAVPGDASAALG